MVLVVAEQRQGKPALILALDSVFVPEFLTVVSPRIRAPFLGRRKLKDKKPSAR